MRRFLSFTVGALIGGLVGSALVLLYTPFSGDEVRTRLSNYSQNMISEIKKAADDRRAELTEELNILKS